MSQQGKIEVGQRYVPTGSNFFGTPPRAVWLVADIRRAKNGILHADIINERQTNRKKTVSTAALEDPRFYRSFARVAQKL